jgi:hypothetical protein
MHWDSYENSNPFHAFTMLIQPTFWRQPLIVTMIHVNDSRERGCDNFISLLFCFGYIGASIFATTAFRSTMRTAWLDRISFQQRTCGTVRHSGSTSGKGLCFWWDACTVVNFPHPPWNFILFGGRAGGIKVYRKFFPGNTTCLRTHWFLASTLAGKLAFFYPVCHTCGLDDVNASFLCRSLGRGRCWEEVIYPGMKEALVHALQVSQGEIEHRKVSKWIEGTQNMGVSRFWNG